jgi:hypothetical protein
MKALTVGRINNTSNLADFINFINNSKVLKGSSRISEDIWYYCYEGYSII